MRVLVACEYSGRVRDAFLARGHDAISCDLLPTEAPGPHYQGDVRDILGDGWDMLPPRPRAISPTSAPSGAERRDQMRLVSVSRNVTENGGLPSQPRTAAHVLDPRGGVTGLKFQSFVRLGTPDYSHHIRPFLESDGGGNSVNRIREIEIGTLLKYNAMDSLLEYHVGESQRKELGYDKG